MASGMERLWTKMDVRRRIRTLVLPGVVTALAFSNPVSPNSAIAAQSEVRTLTGSYLAAQHARIVNDDSSAGQFLLNALARSPDDLVLLRRAYLVLFLDGRIEEGLSVAERYLATGADAYLAELALTIGDIRADRFEAANKRLKNLEKNPLTEFLAPMLRAWVLAGMDRIDETDLVLHSIARNSSTALFRDLHAALILDMVGESEAAAEKIDLALKDQREPWVRLVHLAGRIYHRAGRIEDAKALYDAYGARHPDSRMVDKPIAALKRDRIPSPAIRSAADGAAEALFSASGALARQQGKETALVLGQLGLYLRPAFPSLQLLVADLFEEFDQLPRANALYASIDPGSPFSWAARLSIASNLDQMDRFEEARTLLQDLAAERVDQSRPLSELADMLRRREQFTEAVDTYDAAIARIPTLEPRHWRILYARGVALERAKMWPRAEEDFLQALEFQPDQPFVLNYLGYSWVEQGRNLEQAESMIRKAVELRPTDGYIVDSLGWVLYRLGRYDEAVTELERAVELRPDDPVINDHLGDAYWSVGRHREARFQWQASLDLDPDPELKSAVKKKLEQGLLKEAKAVTP